MHYQSTYAPETLERAQVDTTREYAYWNSGPIGAVTVLLPSRISEACVERIEDGEHLKVEDGPQAVGAKFSVRYGRR